MISIKSKVCIQLKNHVKNNKKNEERTRSQKIVVQSNTLFNRNIFDNIIEQK